jgi:hypothetical protein
MAIDKNLIAYRKVLETFGFESKETEKFRNRFSNDKEFQRLIAISDRLHLAGSGSLLLSATTLVHKFTTSSLQYQRLLEALEVLPSDCVQKEQIVKLANMITKYNPPKPSPALAT